MPELIKTADEAEWLEARRKGVTASEIAVVMGLSPWSSPYALYHQKLGILPGQVDSAVMERGRVLEPYVVEKFTERHPEFFIEGDGRALYAHGDRPWQLATPDRLAWESDRHYAYHQEPVAVLETKTASDMSDWGEPGTDEIPVHYRCQALWQMDVMGVSRAHVAVLDVPRWEIREYVVEHAEGCGPGHNMLAYPSLACPACDDVVLMRDAARDFLGRIDRQDPPDVDWRPATVGALRALHPSVEDSGIFVSTQLAQRYRAAVRNYKHWEQRKKLYEAQLRERMGSNRRAHVRSEDIPGGEVIARRDVYEVGESVRKPYTVDKLVAVPPKAKKES